MTLMRMSANQRSHTGARPGRVSRVALAVSAFLVVDAGCGSPPAPERPRERGATTTTSRSTPGPRRQAARSPYGYASSPITVFADEVTALALATLQHKPLPKVTFSLWAGELSSAGQGRSGGRTVTEEERIVAEGNDLVRYTKVTVDNSKPQTTRKVVGHVNRGVATGTPLAWPVRPVAFLLQVDALLNLRAPGTPHGVPELVLKKSILLLDKSGLTVASLRLRRGSGRRTGLPPSLGRLGDLFAPILASLRAGRAPANLTTPRTLADLGSWTRSRCRLPALRTLAAWQQHLQAVPATRPVAYRIRHINLLVVDAKGTTAFLRLRARSSGSRFSLRRLPLVRVDPAPDF